MVVQCSVLGLAGGEEPSVYRPAGSHWSAEDDTFSPLPATARTRPLVETVNIVTT